MILRTKKNKINFSKITLLVFFFSILTLIISGNNGNAAVIFQADFDEVTDVPGSIPGAPSTGKFTFWKNGVGLNSFLVQAADSGSGFSTQYLRIHTQTPLAGDSPSLRCIPLGVFDTFPYSTPYNSGAYIVTWRAYAYQTPSTSSGLGWFHDHPNAGDTETIARFWLNAVYWHASDTTAQYETVYTTNTPYDFMAVLNLDNRKLDIYIDGKKVADQRDLQDDDFDEIYRFNFSLPASSGNLNEDYAIDDILIRENAPPSETTMAATDLAVSTATLNGTVNPNGLVTQYAFQYGLTSSYGLISTGALTGSGTSVISVADGISSLTPSTLYHYRIVAQNELGTTYGDDQTFTTLAMAADTDGDGIVDAADNCPDDYNPDQSDHDGDGFADACDNCPFNFNDSQDDTDGDKIGDACEDYVITSDITSETTTVDAEIGSPLWDTICIQNESTTNPITIIRPDCYNVKTYWKDSGGNIVVPRDRHGKAYGIPTDLITLAKKATSPDPPDPNSKYCITCDISETVAPENLSVDQYTIQHWYSNWFQDQWYDRSTGTCNAVTEGGAGSECYPNVWIGWMKTDEMTVNYIDIPTATVVDRVGADISFNPDHWDVAWATGNSPTISAKISNIHEHTVDQVDTNTTIFLNGDVENVGWIIDDTELYVKFDRALAVQSLLNSAVPGSKLSIKIQGELTDGEVFSGEGAVDIVENTGTLSVQADLHNVGSGSHPGSTKTPIVGMETRVFDKSSGSCAAAYGISWQHYQEIWEGDGTNPACDPVATQTTDGWGKATFVLAPGNYLVIGNYLTDDDIYIGNSVGDIVTGTEVYKYLQVIKKADGKKSPAKYRKYDGSELLVIEPEYVEWSSDTELYPIVFDSVGDWTVTTAVEPPEGFVADNEALSAEVTNEVEAVQFSITDIGSEWVPTKFTHKIKHKKQKEITFESDVGLKLTPELAQKKGVSIWGEDSHDDQHDNQDEAPNPGKGKSKGKKK